MEKVTATKYGQYALSYRLKSRSLYLDFVAVTFSFSLFLLVGAVPGGTNDNFQRPGQH